MASTLPDTINSVLSQDIENFEYLILDDGSTDGTQHIFKEFEGHPKIKLFRFQNNRGLTAARNELLKKAQGEYLSIADADDILLPHKVRLHSELLETHPQVGVVWGSALVSREQRGWEHLPPKNFQPGWDLTSSYWAVHSATTWRKSAVLRAGGYLPDWTEVEAVDLFLRLGDFCEQYYLGELVAFKRINPRNDFRRYLEVHGEKISRQLLLRTLRRRYPKTQGEFLDRLSQ